jgi:integrase
MRNNLEKVIEKYVESKRDIWSNRTLPVVRSTLLSLASHFDDCAQNYKRLIKAGKSRYTIKQYFIVAGKFEEECFGTQHYKTFLGSNRSAFRNCYKEKTRFLTAEKFAEFKSRYLSEGHPAMYNLLVLMGDAVLRITEALEAKWTDLTETELITVIGKGNKQRQVPIDPARLLPNESDYIVERPLAYRFLFQRDMAPFTPHDFRAHYATTLTEKYPELNVKHVATLLGHSSIQTTQKYMRSDVEQIQNIMLKGKR